MKTKIMLISIFFFCVSTAASSYDRDPCQYWEALLVTARAERDEWKRISGVWEEESNEWEEAYRNWREKANGFEESANDWRQRACHQLEFSHSCCTSDDPDFRSECQSKGNLPSWWYSCC